MRPLELRLRNFRSFYGDGHTFTFRGRRLIGVVGPIGSGKSTILDAIAFALYGKTPRIARSTRSLIHQRAQHAAVALRFEVEGEVWEAARLLRRTGASQHALYRLPADTEEPAPDKKFSFVREVNHQIEELLGLDFDGFGRSVLLAQGQFAQFLSAPPAARDKVLKGVFGHQRVGAIRDLAKQAVGRSRHETEKLDIRIEHVEAARTRLVQHREDLAEATARLGQLEEVLPRFEALAARIDQAEKVRDLADRRLAELRERSAELPDPVWSEKALAMVEQAGLKVSSAEQKLQVVSDRLVEAEEHLESEEFEQELERVEESTELLSQLEAVRVGIEARLDDLSRRAREIPDRLEGERVVLQAERGSARRVEADREWSTASTVLERAERVLLSDDFLERRRRAEEASTLMVRVHAADLSLQDAVLESRQATDNLAEDEAAETEARSALDRAGSSRERVETAARQATSRLAVARDRLQEALHADMAGSLRERLASGDACPVCEQPVHRVPPAAGGDTDAARRRVERARSERDTTEKLVRSAVGTEQAARARLDASAERRAASILSLVELRGKEEQRHAQLAKYQDRLRGLLGDGPPEVRLDEERAALDGLTAAAEEARVARDEARAALDEAMEEQRRVQEAVSDLRTRIGTLGAMLHADFPAPESGPGAVRQGLAHLDNEWRRTIANLTDDLRREQQKIEAAALQRTKAQARVDAFRQAASDARTARDQARDSLDKAVTLEKQARRKLSDLLARIGSLGVVLHSNFRIPRDDPDALRAALASLHEGWRHETGELEATVERSHSERGKATAGLQELRDEYRIDGSIDSALAELRAKHDHIAAEVDRHEKLVAGLDGLREERRKRQDEVRLNQRLVRDLTDARFIRFLLDEERADLSELGSEHFERLSSGRYRFTGDGQFHVVDLNSADAIRRADSLSGGETFLASLSLALALAEMVGRGGGRLDAFFLDEGIGTLDPEHLDLAMAGIESLVSQRHQRLVVVVSHVPELRERIEDLIELDKAALTGDSVVVAGAMP